ncbi:hypothetical protein E4U19_000766 [Claviceps sp. Clav32 group G5]|nr:hypothetical protein E4U19_000766 [Claviceps sp. Clav32 group G5]
MLRFGVAGGRKCFDKLCFSKSTLFETNHIFDAASFIFNFQVLRGKASAISLVCCIVHGTEASHESTTSTMHTPLDNAMRSKNMVLAFGAAVVAAAVWSIWGTEMFPPPPDPKGDPETWTREEMRRWLAARNLFPQGRDSREDLLERIQANMRVARK